MENVITVQHQKHNPSRENKLGVSPKWLYALRRDASIPNS